MIKLILIRHGETDKNIGKKLHQAQDLESLNGKGVGQMEKTASALKTENVGIIYSSNEQRAIESGKILSRKLAVPFKIILGMQERNWGKFSGKPWPEVEAILKPMSFDERYNYVPPGGESWKEFETRLIGSLKRILNENQGKTVIIVSHGGAIRALMPYLLNVPKGESFKYDPHNASITSFDYDGEKFFPKTINDTAHL